MTRKQFNMICAGGAAFFLLLLIVMFLHERRQQAVRIEENRQIAARIEEEEGQRRADVEEIYSTLTEALKKGPAGFVCWGDEEMDGNRNGTLAASLDHRIDETYFAPLRTAFLQEGAYEARLSGINVVNMAAANEGMNEIMVRTGAHRMVLGDSLSLLSGNDKDSQVDVTLADEAGNVLRFADQQHAAFGETTIDGVKGHLYTGSEAYDDLHSVLAFRRNETGDAYVIPAGEEVETAGGENYRDYYPVMFFAEREDVSAAQFAGYMQEILDRYGRRGRAVVVCVTAQDSEWDRTLQETFGDHYLRQDKSVDEMTADDYDALAERVFDAFASQDTFNRVKKAAEEALDVLQGK